jgi:protein SCO1/2
MKKYIPATIIIACCLGALIISTYKNQASKKQTVRLLPIYGNKSVQNTDTIYHTIAPFSFINQLNDTITQRDTENKNYVVEYFFTTCQSICPIMNNNMMKVAAAYKADTAFKILSHTVRPEEESVPLLIAYANEHQADHKNWWFLTGNKKELYDLARKSYLMNNEEGSGDADDFIHSQLFALIDKDRHIRGFYDGTLDADIAKLIRDVTLLKQEQQMNLANK